jgi:hypothetical protein
MGTATLIVLGVAWLVVALSLGFQLIRPRPSKRGSRRMGAGLLLIMSAAVASSFAHQRDWPIPRLLELGWLTMLVGLIGGGCVVASLVIRIRRSG